MSGLAQRVVVVLLHLAGRRGGQMVAAGAGLGERLGTERRHPHWKWLLHRPRRHPHVLEVVILSVVIDLLFFEASPDQREPLVHPGAPIIVWNPEDSVLIRAAARADREIQAAVGEDIDRRGILGGLNRIVLRQQIDERADADMIGARRDRGQDRKLRRRPSALHEVMLAGPEMAEAELLAEDRILDKAFVNVLVRTAPLGRVANNQYQAKIHLPVSPV